MTVERPSLDTLAVHAGEEHNPTTGLVTPIYCSSTFKLPDAATSSGLSRHLIW